MKRLRLILYILVLIILAEAVLRLQQKMGPVVDLELNEVTWYRPSEILNHIPYSHKVFYLDNEKKVNYYDENGIRINRLRPHLANEADAFKILFMGDSFMEGYGDEHTIPQYIWSYLQNKEGPHINLLLLNAGYTTYSPTIFIPQAKKLIPSVKPNLVIVDIDETDLGDDYIRYRKLRIMDDEGKTVAVKSTPIHRLYNEGFEEIQKQVPIYLLRFVMKMYHTRIRMPSVIRKYRQHDPRQDVLFFSRCTDKNAKEIYKKEISFFKSTLTELLETLIDLMGEEAKIMLVYHPHLNHLKPDDKGFYWNTLVSQTIQEVATDYNITFYNSTEDLRKQFKGVPEKYYQSNDMHFTYEGLEIYGVLVAKKILPRIKELISLRTEENSFRVDSPAPKQPKAAPNE